MTSIACIQHHIIAGAKLEIFEAQTFLQEADTSAAASALAPAYNALEDGMHKAPAGRAFPPASPGSRTGKTLIHADCPFLMRFTAAWVYVAMATAGVSLLEKQKEYETACDLLRQLLGTRPIALICLNPFHAIPSLPCGLKYIAGVETQCHLWLAEAVKLCDQMAVLYMRRWRMLPKQAR